MSQFQLQDLYSSNFPLLARDFEDGLGSLSLALFDDEDLIPILDREDDDDLSRPDSSRCSSLSIPSPGLICPTKEYFPACNHLENVTYKLPRAPPPTPLPTSPMVLPRSQDELHLGVPPFDLNTSLAELGVCAAMGNPVFIRRPSWDFNVEENLSCNVEQISKNVPESWAPSCTFCDLSRFDNRQSAYQQEVSSEEPKSSESQLYQFPPLASYGHPGYSPPTPPPSICSYSGDSLDDDTEEITWHSFLRQPYSMVEIDYQLQLLSIKQQSECIEETETLTAALEIPEIEQPKRKIQLRNTSLSSVGGAGGTLKRRISRAIKRSLSR